jgi:hypothetical protein
MVTLVCLTIKDVHSYKEKSRSCSGKKLCNYMEMEEFKDLIIILDISVIIAYIL